MKHEQWKQQLQLLVLGELEQEERSSVEFHVAGCQECRADLESLKKLYAVISGAPHGTMTESLLQEARQELRAALRLERLRVTLWNRLTDSVDAMLAPWAKVSVAGAAMVAMGFLAGYLSFGGDQGPTGIAIQSTSGDTDITRGEARITNVRFDDADPSDGEIEFTFDAVSPVRVKGSPNDPGVQSVLTRALITEENPGVRLRTVSAITSQIQIGKRESEKADEDVKRALIDAMKFDDNPGVRKEALQALKKFPFDPDIKQGLLYVLSKDRSEGLRVEAINSLAAARSQFHASDDHLMDILQKRMETDNNRYIRQRARAVLEEVKQQ